MNSNLILNSRSLSLSLPQHLAVHSSTRPGGHLTNLTRLHLAERRTLPTTSINSQAPHSISGHCVKADHLKHATRLLSRPLKMPTNTHFVTAPVDVRISLLSINISCLAPQRASWRRGTRLGWRLNKGEPNFDY
jgi:hypothetical protein